MTVSNKFPRKNKGNRSHLKVATPIQTYKKTVRTYKALEKQQFHVEEANTYNDGGFDTVLNFFKYKGLDELNNEKLPQIYIYDAKTSNDEKRTIMSMNHAIVGTNSDDTFLRKKFYNTYYKMLSAVEENYGSYSDFDAGDLEDIYFIGSDDTDEIIERAGKYPLRKEVVEVKDNNSLTVFTKSKKGVKSKAIIIPTKEEEKFFLNTFGVGNLKILDEETSEEEVIRPYEVASELYKNPKDFAVIKSVSKAPTLSAKMLKMTLMEKGIKVRDVKSHSLNYRPYVPMAFHIIDDHAIASVPRAMVKVPYNPAHELEQVSFELYGIVNEEVGEVDKYLETFNHGFWYRLKGSPKRKETQITINETSVGIPIKMEQRNGIVQIEQEQVRDYTIKKLFEGMKK